MGGKLRVPIVNPRSRVQLDQRAERTLREFAPECLIKAQPTPVLRLLEFALPKLDFRFQISELGHGIEGLTDCGERTVSVTSEVYEGLETDDGRCRFSGAHELGHVIVHSEELAPTGAVFWNGSKGPVLARSSEIVAYKNPEWQADWFAGALLMPKGPLTGVVKRAARIGHDPAFLAAALFHVSKSAAQTRIAKLGLVG